MRWTTQMETAQFPGSDTTKMEIHVIKLDTNEQYVRLIGVKVDIITTQDL